MSRDTFDLSKDFDWMCERGGHFPIMHPLDLRRGGEVTYNFGSCFQVSAGFQKQSDKHISVAVAQRQRKGAGVRVRFQLSELMTTTLAGCFCKLWLGDESQRAQG